MAKVDIEKQFTKFITPYIPFPKNPRIVSVGKYNVQEYVSPEDVHKHVKAFAEKVDLNNFDAILINLEGGFWFFNELLKIKKHIGVPTIMIEYHRPGGGFGANVTIPIPESLMGKNCGVIDDIRDSAGVLREIMSKLGPDSKGYVLVDKRVSKFDVPNVYAAMQLDDKWLGGGGLNFGHENEGPEIRNYPGIVVDA